MNPAHRAIIEALCTEIETSIREGSTIVESPACKAARQYLADTAESKTDAETQPAERFDGCGGDGA